MGRALHSVFWACLMPLPMLATHIIGGEMYYDHLGGNQYRITLDLYRDCGPTNANNTGFDTQISIGVFNSSGVLVQNPLVLSGVEEIVPIVITNPCLSAPPELCIATMRYQTIVNLPPIAGGYSLSYQRCCRTPAIINLMNPGGQGLTCTIQIPGPANAVNSSPRFDSYPPVVLCVGETLTFDHGATDPDGDVLVYEFCTPFQGGSNIDPMPAVPTPPPYATVPWAAGFSANAPLDSDPDITLDPATGMLEVTPTQIGAYTVGVCVKEFRNGVLLGETRRDFLFNAVVCDPNIVSVIADQEPAALCSGLTQSFTNQSINGQFWSWDFGDPGTTDDVSDESEPTWTYANPGTYTVTLIANPGWPCADTSVGIYEARLPLDPVFLPPTGLCGPSFVELSVDGNFTSDASISWDLGGSTVPASAVGPTASATFQPAGAQAVTVTVSEFACTDSYTADVVVNPIPIPVIEPQQDFCTGLELTFTGSSTGGSSLRWDFGDPTTLADSSVLASPTWTYAQTGNYIVTLTADPTGPCPASTTGSFEVYVDLVPFFPQPPIACPNASVVFEVSGNFSSNAQVTWDFGAVGEPSSAIGHSAISRFESVGEHPVTVSVSENGCSGSYQDLVLVHPFPIAAFTSDSRACVGAEFAFQDLSEAWTPMSYSWDFGDGTSSTEPEPSHVYLEPGMYTVGLTVSTSEGCIASDMMIHNGQVEVFPNPVPGFSALPREVSVFDPVISVEDYAWNAVSWVYSVEGVTYLSHSFTHSFEEGGQFIITQTVTSDDGCSASMDLIVFVSDHIFWAPTAFTPDGDGLNDEWLPTVIGARHYELQIFDRWGEVRFATRDPKAGWSGDELPTGVYSYRVRIKEWGADAREYLGHFTLLR